MLGGKNLPRVPHWTYFMRGCFNFNYIKRFNSIIYRRVRRYFITLRALFIRYRCTHHLKKLLFYGKNCKGGIEVTTLIKVGNQYNIPVKQYYCDTQEDFAEIQEQNCPIGTEVYILQKNQIKVFGPNGWTNKASGGSGELSPEEQEAANEEIRNQMIEEVLNTTYGGDGQ